MRRIGLLGLVVSVLLTAPSCAHIRKYNSPEHQLRYKLEHMNPGRTLRVESSSGETVTGVLERVQWPQLVLLSGESRTEVNLEQAETVLQRYQSKLWGGVIGATVLGVTFGIAGSNLAKHPPCLNPDGCDPADPTSGDVARGTVLGAAFGAIIGGMLGSIVTPGTTKWKQLYP